MKKYILVILISLFLTLILSGNIMALNQEKQLNMLIDIKPYIILELGKDIDIEIDEPWQGGTLKEDKSSLNLTTNTDVLISWESTVLINQKKDKILPLGISTDFIQRLKRGEKVEAEDQAFGLNTFLVRSESETDNNSSGLRKENDDSILSSKLVDGNRLQSQHSYQLEPGIHNFDIIVQYYWAREGNWSKIIAGEYTGEIIYTVAAVEDGTE